MSTDSKDVGSQNILFAFFSDIALMNNLAMLGLWEQFVTFYFKIFSSLPVKVRLALGHCIKGRTMIKVVQKLF